MKLPTIAVVIPAYNEEKFIGECLRSVAAQSRPADEIIVVDNNSTDRTVEIAKEFKGVRVVRESEQGRGAARRKGFDAASSDVLVRIDADSRPTQHWLEVVEKAFSNPRTAAWSGYVTSSETRLQWLSSLLFNFFTFRINRLLSGHHVTFGSNMALRRELWDKYKIHIRDGEDIWEDIEVSCVLAEHNHRVAIDRRYLMYISMRASDTTLSGLVDRLRAWPKTFWPYHKIGALLSIPISVIAIVFIVVLDRAGRTISRPDRR